MKYVIDSSVALKWVLREVDSDKADRLRDDYRNAVHELLAPDVFQAECAHGLTRTERQGRIPIGEAAFLWADIMSTSPHLDPLSLLLPQAIRISSQLRIGVYDCLYVILAHREGCDLITGDEKLVKNVHKQFPFVKLLASLS
jgi:predicted nucleic acid-binding protein